MYHGRCFLKMKNTFWESNGHDTWDSQVKTFNSSLICKEIIFYQKMLRYNLPKANVCLHSYAVSTLALQIKMISVVFILYKTSLSWNCFVHATLSIVSDCQSMFIFCCQANISLEIGKQNLRRVLIFDDHGSCKFVMFISVLMNRC